MKRLTITLLTLLVLGGCSQEPTELERCIEANTDASVPPSFKLVWFYLKAPAKEPPPVADFDKCLLYNPSAKKYVAEINKLVWDRAKAREKKDKEKEKELGKEIERIDAENYSELKLIWEICEETEKRKAEKICHSQGIY